MNKFERVSSDHHQMSLAGDPLSRGEWEGGEGCPTWSGGGVTCLTFPRVG